MSTLARAHKPAMWHWTGRRIRNGVGQRNCTFTYVDGTPGTAKLVLRWVSNAWMIDVINLNKA